MDGKLDKISNPGGSYKQSMDEKKGRISLLYGQDSYPKWPVLDTFL